MNQTLLRVAGLTAIVATLATVSLVNASAATKPDSCPTDKPLVVDSYFTSENSADYGADGQVWALDAGTRFIRIWRMGGDAYCLQIHDVGTFTTFAGLSPEGTGTVFFIGGGYLEVSGQGEGPHQAGLELWLQVRDIEATRRELDGVPILREPRREPWGLIEMWIADPDGVRICVAQIPDDHPMRRRV